MTLGEAKKIYFSGIGGIGVSALVKYCLAIGKQVAGSDLASSELTADLENRGVTVNYGQTTDNIQPDVDLLIYSAAVPTENPERQRAKELNIVQKSYFEILGEISREFETISVAGTNGKSTTTAMLASIMLEGALDPTVIVGSQFSQLDRNFRLGQSKYFLLESCEYRAHLLLLKPWSIILTNIEEDHLDYFRDLNHIIQTFQQFVNNLKHKENILVINNDDPHVRELALPDCTISTYGLAEGADLVAQKIRKLPGRQQFNAIYKGQDLGEFELKVPGNFNIYNALAAISFSLMLNLSIGSIKRGLANYAGIWRRFEIIKDNDITVVSDYGHHPTAIKATIQAAKEFYPDRRVVVVFQPHQKNRTQNLFRDFSESFGQADVVLIPKIYEVTGRDEGTVTSEDLVRAIQDLNPAKQVIYSSDLAETLAQVNELKQAGDVILVMGAGDVYKIANEI